MLPRKTALTIVLFGAIILPAVYWPQITAILQNEPKPVVLKLAEPPKPAAPPIPNLEVPAGSLDRFYNALRRVETRQIGAIVRVLHYGDSPTTADSIMADVRSLFQARFGDAGHGFVLIAKPWAWYGHRGIQIDAKNWQIEAASMKRAADHSHGLGGVNFIGGIGAVSKIRLPDERHTSVTVHYLQQPDGGSFTVSSVGPAGETELGTVDTAAEVKTPAFQEFALPNGTRTVELRVISGKIRAFGYRFDKPGPGLQYSSLGINGAHVEMLVRSFQKEDWRTELREENPDLLVLNYGTNESIFPAYIEKQYPVELRSVLTYLKAALPETSILVMSPMDRGTIDASGNIVTPDALLKLIAVQRQVAADLHCAFFNTFEAMGSKGTMGRWYNEEQPRLVSADFMHPLPAGAAKVGALVEAALVKSYEQGSYQQTTRAVPSR